MGSLPPTHPLATVELLALEEELVLLWRPPAAALGLGVLILTPRLLVVNLVGVFLQPVVALVAPVELRGGRRNERERE